MTERVTMTALDTMHISNVQADNLKEGDVFTCTEQEAKQLEQRGLAERGGKASDAVNGTAAAPRPDTREELDAERGDGPKAISAAPENKMVAAPPNKAASTEGLKK